MIAASQGDQAAAESLASDLAESAESGDWAALVAAIRRVLDGERDEDTLAAGLDDIDRAILHQVLAGIASAAGGRGVGGQAAADGEAGALASRGGGESNDERARDDPDRVASSNKASSRSAADPPCQTGGKILDCR